MANEPIMTVVGNLAGDPELRFTANGHAVANFTIAQTPRNFNRETSQWDDDETLWFRCSVWREAAENVAESLTKGMRVVATGRLKARSFEDKQGNQRTNWELDVDEVGPSLRWATAQVARSQPGQGGGGAQAGGNPWANSQYTQQPQQGQPQQAQPMNQPQGQPQGQQGQFQQPQQGGNAWTGQPGGWDQQGQQDGPPPF